MNCTEYFLETCWLGGPCCHDDKMRSELEGEMKTKVMIGFRACRDLNFDRAN
jgi:hypothetical protein